LNRPVLLSLLVYGLVIVSLVTLQAGYIALALVFTVYLLAGLIYGPETSQLVVERELSTTRALQDTEVAVNVKVTNQGKKLEQVWFEDFPPEGLNKLEGDSTTIVSLNQGEATEVTYTIQAQRGSYHFQELEVWTSDHLGMIKSRRRLEAMNMLSVAPSPLNLPRIPIRPQQTREYPGVIPARKAGTGTDFFGVRDYQQGDSPRQINWRASARLPQSLFSNEYQLERAADISLILDARQDSYFKVNDQSLFEFAVTATASLAQAFLRDGNRVGLIHYGQYIAWTFPGYGKVQRERILQALAHAQPGDSLVDHLEYLPVRFFTPRSQVVLISPLQPKDLKTLLNFRALGYAMLLISPDPVAFELSLIEKKDSTTQLAARIARLERIVLLNQLQQAGVRILDWNTSQPLDQAIFTITRGLARFEGGRR
jgi:uncharacterized protein (DUF58 family)